MLQTWQSIDLWKRVLIGLFIGLFIGVFLYYGVGNPKLVKKQYSGQHGRLSIEDYNWEYELSTPIAELQNSQSESFELDVDDGSKVTWKFDVQSDSNSFRLTFTEPKNEPLRSTSKSNVISSSFA